MIIIDIRGRWLIDGTTLVVGGRVRGVITETARGSCLTTPDGGVISGPRPVDLADYVADELARGARYRWATTGATFAPEE